MDRTAKRRHDPSENGIQAASTARGGGSAGSVVRLRAGTAGDGGNRDQLIMSGNKEVAGACAIRPQPMVQQRGAVEAGVLAVPS